MGGKKQKNSLSKQELKMKEIRRNLNTITQADNGLETLQRICQKQGHKVPTRDVAKGDMSYALTDTRSAIATLGLR